MRATSRTSATQIGRPTSNARTARWPFRTRSGPRSKRAAGSAATTAIQSTSAVGVMATGAVAPFLGWVARNGSDELLGTIECKAGGLNRLAKTLLDAKNPTSVPGFTAEMKKDLTIRR